MNDFLIGFDPPGSPRGDVLRGFGNAETRRLQSMLERVLCNAEALTAQRSRQRIPPIVLHLVLASGASISLEATAEMVSPDGVTAAAPRTGRNTPSGLGLTPRQGEVLGLILAGKSNKEIGRALALAEGTVKNHVAAVLKALEVTTRTQAVIAASRLGLEPEG